MNPDLAPGGGYDTLPYLNTWAFVSSTHKKTLRNINSYLSSSPRFTPAPSHLLGGDNTLLQAAQPSARHYMKVTRT